jgi:ADP-dependent NAD(P)H-hydrate dehydratase / NAD(P)H-hydrate epimerase
MKLVSVAEMVAVEREANASGLSYSQMMENAGRGLAEQIQSYFGSNWQRGVLGLVGSGNNGGDTLVALAVLVHQGCPVCAYLVKERPENDPLVTRLHQAGGRVIGVGADPDFHELRGLLAQYAIVLDGILGTGIQLPLRGRLADILEVIGEILSGLTDPPYIVAVDCPSGVDCDSGEAAPECLPAHLTVTMAAVKQGLYKFPAFNLVGELKLVGIGLPEEGEALEAWRSIRTGVADRELVRDILPERAPDSHKGTFGTALVVAGSLNYTGAAALAGEAAYRSGAGLVTLAVPAPLHSALAGHLPEVTWLLLPEAQGGVAASAAGVLFSNLERVTGLLLGPGFGLKDPTAEFVNQFVEGCNRFSTQLDSAKEAPGLVLDADGLKLLSQVPDWPRRLPAPAVLTPHPGEMSYLTGLSVANIQSDRMGTARKFSQEWGHVVILKGAFTVVAAPDGQGIVVPVASSALARAGSGDVLAGLVVGLRAQGVPAFEAAVAAAWIHAQAGLLAANHIGNTASVLAGDILRSVPEIISDLS